MITLAVETSCDETAAALLDDDRVLVSIARTQQIHSRFGGVVPEIASREHIRLIDGVIKEALTGCGIRLEEIDLLAATRGPGLLGALLVGFHFTSGLALRLQRPFMAVNHMEGHIYANYLNGCQPRFPALILVVSGGHTQLVLFEGVQRYRLLGETRDDAAGEAFDKGAKILQLGYPGGPVLAARAEAGDPGAVKFPRGMLRSGNLEFSFSGLKTALLHHVRGLAAGELANQLPDIAASYQEAIVDVLASKTADALRQFPVRQLLLAGGVAANRSLRERIKVVAGSMVEELVLPELAYCTDNAAMIARAGLARYLTEGASPDGLDAVPNLSLHQEREVKLHD
ncbi:tRNA (adenosine(37)-N6)-threonylcarbamoyltransferase complex transferase subunit TsaD [bacterium]|nr:tRNA (adenosine(37)-N6)-threonylcarbamoyltransferase complex transferase subunit TsaD [bacterium]